MKKQAITLVEIIVSVTILSVILIMLSGVITKKAQNAADITSGTFACYKDTSGNLNQKVRLGDGTIQEKRGIEQCNFTFPSGVNNYRIYVIGGGGGGGKISENNSDYWEEIPGETKRFVLFTKNSTDCLTTNALAPIMSEDQGTGSVIKYDGLSCSGYQCASSTKIITFDETKEYANFFDKESLELVALTNRSFFIQGGEGNTGIAGAMCTITADLSFDKQFNYFDGKNGYQCNEGASMPTISASPGIFQIENKYVFAQGGDFIKEHAFDVVSARPKCKSNGLHYTELESTTALPEEDEITYSLLKLKTYYSNGGEAGTTISNNSINLAGRTVIISKNQIGNGGQPGENGEATNYENFNMTAWGGNAGSVIPGDEITTTLAVAKITGGENGAMGLASFYNGVYPLSASRLKYSFKENPDNAGEMSGYVKDVAILGIANQEKFTGRGANCSSDLGGCRVSKSPDEESYGSGGGGASSMVRYDPFYKFIYTRSNYATGTRENIINSTYIPVVTKSQASNGMGGAVVIEW